MNIKENLAINSTSHDLDKEENSNDEKIIAECFYRALTEKKHVAVITRDHRFKKIAIKTQRELLAYPEIYGDFSELFQDAMVSVIFGRKGRGFSVVYCTEDFMGQPSVNNKFSCVDQELYGK